MNNQELLYKIATDQRFANTFRLAIQVQKQLQLHKQAKMDDGISGAIAAGRKRQDANKKKKETASAAEKQQPKKEQPKAQTTDKQDTAPKTSQPDAGYNAGRWEGRGEVANTAIQGGLGAILGRYGLGGLAELLGRGVAYARNAGGRSMLRQMTTPRTAAGPGGGMATYNTTFTDAAGHPITAANIRTNMADYSNRLSRGFGRWGRGIGTVGGAAAGIATSLATNNWLSNYIKSQFGSAA